MKSELNSIIVCPNCGSTEYLQDYPSPGLRLCGECGRESIEIQLKTVEPPQEIPTNCPFCGEKCEDKIPFYFDDFKTVNKCKKCGKLNGYYCVEQDYYMPHERSNSDYSRLEAKIAGKEGKPILSSETSKRIASEIKREANAPIAKCKEKLVQLIQEKNTMLKSANLDSQILSRARNQVHSEIERNGPFTEKQLQILYPAAILEAQETLFRLKKISDKRITERQLEEIFTADRKTLRKWKRQLLQD